MKQTAVEWFIEQLRNNENIRWRGTNIIELREQAKEMEKEQMRHWFGLGMHLVEGKLWKPIDKFEENFNETYGGNNV
jgi:hypothetical protein